MNIKEFIQSHPLMVTLSLVLGVAVSTGTIVAAVIIFVMEQRVAVLGQRLELQVEITRELERTLAQFQGPSGGGGSTLQQSDTSTYKEAAAREEYPQQPTPTNSPQISKKPIQSAQGQDSGNLPDLAICLVNVPKAQITICNAGIVPIPVDFIVAWSESWYNRADWRNTSLLRFAAMLPPRGALQIPLGGIDVGTEFMVDVDNRVTETNETNNCVNAEAKILPCR